MKANEARSIDEYLADLPQEVKETLERLRHAIQKAAPKAEERISYKMPAFYYEGPLVYFAAFKNHCSFFPGNSRMVKELKDELKAFASTTGTIQFTVEKPLPVKLVTKMVKQRVKENEEKAALKKSKAKTTSKKSAPKKVASKKTAKRK